MAKTKRKKAAVGDKAAQSGVSAFRGAVQRLLRVGLVFVLLLVAFDALAVWAVRSAVTIHSCTPYVPQGHFGALRDVTVSLSQYSEAQLQFEEAQLGVPASEGVFRVLGRVRTLWDMLVQLVKGELHLGPPFFDASPVVGKRILVVGGSYINQFFSHARVLGAELYLVDDPSVADKAIRKLGVPHFIPVPEFQRISIQEPNDVVKLLQEYSRLNSVTFDGVLTLVEDEAPLTARLAAAFGVPGHSPEAADNARSKTRVRKAMNDAGLPTPSFFTVNNMSDFESQAALFQSIEYPLFLKPVWGVAAAFAMRVDSFAELQSNYSATQASINPDEHSIFHYGSQMVVEEMLLGEELQLELMLLDGELVFHCFSSEYAHDRKFLVFPPRFTDNQKNASLELAYKTARALGLRTGILHIEMFWTPRGNTNGEKGTPQIIEINNRLSRGFLPQSFWHQLAFGQSHTDYFASAIFLSVGAHPPVFQRARPPLSLAVFLDEPSPNGWETYSECAVFFDSDPISAVQKGQRLLGFASN